MESAYAASLPPRERKLAGRLEGFGDIVFGFAVSQCALQLPMVRGHADLGHAGGLAAYFGTFSILASLWLTFHALMSGSFRPTGIDLFLAFGYLALVTLMPYALYSASHQTASLAVAQAAVAEYAFLFASLLLIAATVTVRNLRRGWYMLDEGERLHVWQSFVRRVAIAIVMLVAFGVDLCFGPVSSTFVFLTLTIVPRMTKIVVKAAPEKALRIASPAGTPLHPVVS